jgi:hypothetical protein
MFWIVALTAITPIAFLALIRYEPTARDVDEEEAAAV